VDEADIGNVKKGQRVTFTVDAFPENTFEGHVEEVRLRPSVSSNVVTYSTIIDAPNSDLKLKPGMTANITVFTQEIQNTLLVSAKATRFRPDSSLYKTYTIEGGRNRDGQKEGVMHIGSNAPKKDTGMNKNGKRDTTQLVEAGKTAIVWVKKDSTLIRRKIKIGLTDDTNVQVLSGLSTDDVVVTGSHQESNSSQASSGSPRSPFMPQRRGGGNRSTSSGGRSGR
jgi:HlyD family secretion protein